MTDEPTQPRISRRLSWRWVLLVSGGVTALLFAGAVVPLIGEGGRLFWSDKADPASYGFELSNLAVDRDLLVGGARRDELRALDAPEVVTPKQADAITQQRRRSHQGKFLVVGDRVVGVTIAGESRAYPLRILNWHEVINDTLGGVPIAVTFSGLCDSVVVFDRRVEGEPLELGTSGLLYNSNLVMYDRRPDGEGESLWSQLGLRAIAGPALGRELRPLPMSVTTWQDWRIAHPETTVVIGRHDYLRLYKRDPYAAYLRNPGLKFPVRPALPETTATAKERVIAIQESDGWRLQRLGKVDATPRATRITTGGALLEVTPAGETQAPTFTFAAGADRPVIYSLWFAWYANHGGELPSDEQARVESDASSRRLHASTSLTPSDYGLRSTPR